MKRILLCITSAAMGFASLNAQVHLGTGQTYANISDAAPYIQPGDTVYIHPGTYDYYQGISALKGTSAKPIVITRYKNEAHQICGCWQFMSCEYIKFQYLNFQGNPQHPGRLVNVDNSGDCATQSKGIIFDSCYFRDVTDANAVTALKFGGVDDFQVTNCVFKNAPGCDLLDFNVCRHGLIKGNWIEGSLTSGHIKGGSVDITMERNIFVNASSGGWVAWELGGDSDANMYCPNDTFEVSDVRFFSNIIIGGGRGFALSSARNCKVYNNTFYNTSGATFRLLCVSTLFPRMYSNKVENNIFAFGASSSYFNAGGDENGDPHAPGSTTFSNNIYYSISNSSFNGPYWDSPETDNVKEQNPLIYSSGTTMFVDASKNDFHLAAGSPAIGAGKSESTPTVDYFGDVFKASRSIGASEFNSVPENVVSIKSKSVTNNFVCFPNPSNTNRVTLLAYDAKFSASVKTVQVISITGEVVISNSVNQLPVELDLAGLSKGIYLLQLKGEDFVATEKLVVE